MNTVYGDIEGLVCVRYWLDAWEVGWNSFPKAHGCYKQGFLSSDYSQASIDCWSNVLVEDKEIQPDNKRGYYAILPGAYYEVICSEDPVGIVEARGKIHIHSGGWVRAEQMRILHLFIPLSCDSAYLKQIKDRYRVPINLVDTPKESARVWLNQNPWVYEHNESLLGGVNELV